MNRSILLKRLLATVVILLLGSGITAALGPGARAVVGGYVEVHEVICPPGYTGDNLFEDCHGNRRPDVLMTATGPGGQMYEDRTNAQGVITFGDFLTPGTITVAESEPTGDFAKYIVYCSRVDNQQPVSFEYRGNGRAAFALDMPADVISAGTGILCDWYNIPAGPAGGASLAIHKSICPAGVTDHLFENCHENGLTGVGFKVTGPVDREGRTAGHLGAIRWDDLPAGTYTISESMPAPNSTAYCTRADTGAAIPSARVSDNPATIQVDVPANVLVVCDWYNFAPPASIEQGTIRVQKIWAPGQAPSEVVQVCFFISTDQAGNDVIGRDCTSDESYTVNFGPSDPPLETGFVYYVWEETGGGWAVAGHNPVAVSISTAIGQAAVTFENWRQDGTAMVELHKRICPAGAPVQSIFAECHGNAPQQPVEFTVDGGEPQAVDAAGNVNFTELSPGTHQFSEVEGPPLDFVDLRVFCSTQGTGEAVNEVPTDGPNFSVNLNAGEFVVCDVYNIPEQMQGAIPTAPVEPPAVMPTSVPVVGRPIHVHAGTCGHLASSPRFSLTDLTTPVASENQRNDVFVAEVSTTVIPISVDELLSGEYAINAHTSEQEMRRYVACGNIGGPRRADGSVAIGLSELNHSGFIGVAVLQPAPTDPSQTQVTVYLVQGLTQEEAPAGTPAATPSASPASGR
ncbi:MAG TPA: hypothetical protein VFL82_06045 [Thermomicrobiales bacterium]|nr:hypothetical protein [Thermomicrobiales bacterium]